MGGCGSSGKTIEEGDDAADAPGAKPSNYKKRGSTDSLFRRASFVVDNKGCLTDSYEIEQKTLGEGAFGSVSQGYDKATGGVRAIKSVVKAKCNVERLKSEIEIMKRLDHPNILKLYETFEDNRYIYLIMELCTGGELIDRISEMDHFTEAQAANVMRQIFQAVFYMHNAMYCHRDIKPENFLLQTKDALEVASLKLIDFGLSCRIEPGKMMTMRAGTPYYVSPQVLDRCYDESCDLWSCGVIMYEILCGYPPFHAEEEEDLFKAIKDANVVFKDEDFQNVSDDAKELISWLLQIDPTQRPSPEQALNHAWVKSKAPQAPEVPLGEGLIKNFKKFRRHPRLKKAALHVIASHLDESQIKGLQNMFKQLDSNGDGAVSAKEMSEGLSKAGLLDVVPPDMQEILADIDTDGSGEIDYTEFLAAALDKRLYLQEDVCWSAFRVFDRDGDGKISKKELQTVLMQDDNVGKAIGKKALSECMKEVDANGDGEIDFKEFMAMMRGTDEDDMDSPAPSPESKKNLFSKQWSQ